MFSRRSIGACAAVTAITVAACGGAGGAGEPVEASAVSVDDSAVSGTDAGVPSRVAPTVDGGQIDFASLEGQDVVLWFWAPW